MSSMGRFATPGGVRFALPIAALFLAAASLMPSAHAQHASRTLEPGDIFDTSKRIIFNDDFRGDFRKWTLSIDAQYDPETRPLISDRVTKEAVPGLRDRLATRFTLPGTPGAFRSELAHPAEEGLQERWYGARIAVDQTTDANGYIVLQWHAMMGADKVNRNFPNLAIHQKKDRWVVTRAWGQPAKIQRSSVQLPGVVVPRQLTNWVLHVKWATDASGLVEIWRDGELVYRQTGQNAYNLSRDRTPYLKAGIYRPSRKEATTTEAPIVVRLSDMRIGRADATYSEVTPVVTARLQNADGGIARLTVPVEFGRDVESGTVAFAAPWQPGVSGAPSSLLWSEPPSVSPLFTVEMANKITGRSRAVKVRGLRRAGCDLPRMNIAFDCGYAGTNYLEMVYDPLDNPRLPPGLHQARLRVEARGWKDKAYQRAIDIDFSIFVARHKGQVGHGAPYISPVFAGRNTKSVPAYVVPVQTGARGPSTVVWRAARQDTLITATVTHVDTGAPYPVVLRARRDGGVCGKTVMNNGASCLSAASRLEVEYRREDQASLPPGKYVGSVLIEAQRGSSSNDREQIALQINATK